MISTSSARFTPVDRKAEEALLFAQQTGVSAPLTAGAKMRAKIRGGDPGKVENRLHRYGLWKHGARIYTDVRVLANMGGRY